MIMNTALKLTGAISQMLARNCPATSLQRLSCIGTCKEAHRLYRHLPALAWGNSGFHTSAILDAARKGTRAKREAKKKAMKKKKEAAKKDAVPAKKRFGKEVISEKPPRRLEDHLTYPVDDVYFTKCYKWKAYSVKEALTMHRETHHETQLDASDSPVHAYFEFYMNLDKKNRFLESISNVVKLPHTFSSGQEKSILVISRNQEVVKYAQEMEVPLVLGPEVIKMAQSGEVNLSKFKYVISELDFLPELVAIRGLMKRQFPNPKLGTAGNDLLPIIDRFMLGIEYRIEKNKFHQDFASAKIPFGTLSMTDEQLEENISMLIRSIEDQRKKARKSTNLISLVTIHSPPSKEKFKIDHFAYIEDLSAKSERVEEKETDENEILAEGVN